MVMMTQPASASPPSDSNPQPVIPNLYSPTSLIPGLSHALHTYFPSPSPFRHSSETGVPPESLPPRGSPPAIRLSPGNPFASATLEAHLAGEDSPNYFADAAEVDEEDGLDEDNFIRLQVCVSGQGEDGVA